MSIFNNIKNFFFEEGDVEVLVDDEIKVVDFKEEVIEEVTPVVKKEEPVILTPKQSIDSKVMKSKKEEPKKFVSIDLDEGPKKQPEQDVSVQRKPMRGDTIKKEEKKDFEFTPVISPIFGAKEDELKKAKKSSQQTVTIHRPKKKANPLGTIISPYFGIGELEEFEAEAQKNIEEKEQIRKSVVQEEKIENDETIGQAEKENLKSISLEEILAMDGKDIAGDDLHQISLFGDSTPVKEAKTSSDLKDIENL